MVKEEDNAEMHLSPFPLPRGHTACWTNEQH